MSQIEQLKKLSSLPKKRKIPREPEEGEEQAEITIYLLNSDDLEILEIGKEVSDEEGIKATKKLIAKSLRIKEEELGTVPLAYLLELLEIIMEVNGMSEKRLDRVHSMVERKQAKLNAKDGSTVK